MKALLLAALAAFAGIAGAAPFADPTRPPNAPAEAATQPDATPAGPRLESVLIAPDRRIAVISGQQVKLGGKFGEGRVVRITETEVAIREGGATQVLRLLPEAQRRTKGQRPEKAKVAK
ncbi:MAG TPA: MSHA biogenesis protein MshK [Burkholderiales bacterium]|nr:MSHA biogenesis protein MshK [Burkholderiales bacterium]